MKEVSSKEPSVRRGYCPHFNEVMDLDDCFFCYFKKVKK